MLERISIIPGLVRIMVGKFMSLYLTRQGGYSSVPGIFSVTRLPSILSWTTQKDSFRDIDKLLTVLHPYHHEGGKTKMKTPSADSSCESCWGHIASCCDTSSGVAFPTVGKSALTGDKVHIIQIFPTFIQPVFFRKCL
ncbi:uncharacterized protein LOC143239567 isoform X1 [Tachypleus tridentatus]|uniref:uncharacterized protein LOC143239567 isoform X1 n=1 Tax=Tachypleus tridentatus TaxID=6853 RepID=UPI003FD29EA3